MGEVLYDFGTGGFAIRFTCAALSTDQYIRVKCDSALSFNDKGDSDREGYIELKKHATYYKITIYDKNEDEVVAYRASLPGTYLDIDITVHGKFVSFYCNKRWVKTFWLSYVQHKEIPTVSVYGTSGVTLTDVVYPELNDWRDAIYIDLEQSGMNGVQSVILSKPVSVWSRYNGDICFAWDPPHEIISLLYQRNYDRALQKDGKACSDGIVYFTDVAVVVDTDYLDEYGFHTSLIRLPDLDEGIQAGIKMQDKARKNMQQRGATFRFNPLVEFEDAIQLSASIESSGLTVDDKFIVENMNINISPTKNSMKLKGRFEP
jgi:hypothetical protein